MRWHIERTHLKLFPPGISPPWGIYESSAGETIQGLPKPFRDMYGTQHPAAVLISWTDAELEKIGVYPDRTP